MAAHHHHAACKKSADHQRYQRKLSVKCLIWITLFLDIVHPAEDGRMSAIKVTGIPGKHAPPGTAGALKAANELFQAVPPTNGWVIELGYRDMAEEDASFNYGY